MKKVTRILGLACMAGLLAFNTSCKKEDNAGMMTVTVSTPEMTVDGADRAYINTDFQFMWEQSDQIYVYNLDANSANSVVQMFHNISGGPRPKAIFKGPSVGRVKGSAGYRFFYPVDMCSGDIAELQTEGNRQTFVVPETQEYGQYYLAGDPEHPYMIVDPMSMPMACAPDKLTSNATMKHMFGLAKFGFRAPAEANKVVTAVEVTDNVFNLNGTVSLNVAAVDTDELNSLFAEYIAGDANYAQHYADYVVDEMGWLPEGDGNKTITLNCVNAGVNGVHLTSASNSEWFYILLRPLALSQGFTVKVYFEDGSVFNINEFWSAANLANTMKPAFQRTFEYPYVITGNNTVGAVWE